MTDTFASPAPPETGDRTRRDGAALRSLGVIACSFLVMLVADLVGSYVFMLALFVNPFFLGILLVAAVLVMVLAALSHAFTGRSNIGGALVVTFVLAVAGGYGLMNGILAPMWSDGGLNHVIICALSALLFGLFLGPWPIRVVGAAGGVALLVTMGFLPTVSERAAEREEAARELRQQQNDALNESAPPPGQETPTGPSDFEKQLPLTGTFVSQGTETTGTVSIAQREDGTVWVTFAGFRTGPATDLRLHLKTDPLVQNADGHWTTDGGAIEIGPIDPNLPEQEIELPGAAYMPAIRTLTVMDYVLPDFPSLGSASLE